MRSTIGWIAKATLFVLGGALPALCPPGLSSGAGAEGTAAASREAGMQTFAGFWTIAAATRTISSSTTILGSASWSNVSGASVTRTVPQGTEETFEVSFTAECQVLRASGFDALQIRVVDNGQPVAEPYDAGQIFCSSAEPVTYRGKWFLGASEGSHTIQVQGRILDNLPRVYPAYPYALLNHITVKVVAYGLGS